MDATLQDQHIALAQSDLKNGDWSKSLARFRWLLLEGDPNPQYEIAYQNTIQTITKENPLRFSLGAALLPSSNVTNGSSQSGFVTDFGVFQIDSAEDRKSGVGLHVNASAIYTGAYAPGRSWSLTASAATNYYDEEELQLGKLGLALGHAWLSSGQQTRLSYSTDKIVYRDLEDRNSPDYRAKGLTLSHNRRLTPKTWLGVQARVQDVTYRERDFNNGRHTSLSLAPRYRLTRQTTVSLKAGVQNVDINATHLSYSGESLGLFLDRNERNGFRWGIGYETYWRDYDTRFPGLQVNRKDQVNDIILSASHSRVRFKGMSPTLRCTLREHGSNVALYDYDTVDCAVSLGYQF